MLANRVHGDVQAFGNTGGLDIADNTIGGNLQCRSNVPPPTGTRNVVSGNMEDQCAALVPAPPVGTGGGGLPSEPSDGGGGAAGLGFLLILLTASIARLAPGLRRAHRSR